MNSDNIDKASLPNQLLNDSSRNRVNITNFTLNSPVNDSRLDTKSDKNNIIFQTQTSQNNKSYRRNISKASTLNRNHEHLTV